MTLVTGKEGMGVGRTSLDLFQGEMVQRELAPPQVKDTVWDGIPQALVPGLLTPHQALYGCGVIGCVLHVTPVFSCPQLSQCAAWSSLWDERPSTGG